MEAAGLLVGRITFLQNGSIKNSEFKGQMRHGYIHSFSLANTSYKDYQSSQPFIKLFLNYRFSGGLQNEVHCFIPSCQDA